VSYGLRGHVLGWFHSYLDGRTQYVHRGTAPSTVTVLLCGVPQGSVLGPILFVLYTADLLRLVDKYQLCPHLYADDTQIYGSCHPSAVSQLQERISACVDEVALWMRSNRLQLNASKTEVSGARPVDVSIRSHDFRSEYALILFSLHPLSVIFGSAWTSTHP